MFVVSVMFMSATVGRFFTHNFCMTPPEMAMTGRIDDNANANLHD
jgi:hypothetical protein